MPRYFAKRPRSFDDDYWPESPICTSLTVDEHVAVDTGLLDADGNSIWRAPNPMGFGRDEEW
jgi:hypothetical protein